MNELLKVFLSLSLSGSLLILLFMLLKPMLKKHVSRLCQYYIWLIVLARLVLPFTPTASLMGEVFERIGAVPKTAAASQENLTGSSATVPPPIVSDSFEENQTKALTPSPTAAPNAFEVIIENLWIIWLAGTVILLIRKITAYQSFVAYIKASRQQVEDVDVLERFSVLLKQSQIKRHVELYSNSLVSTPLLIGFFHPCIILPTIDLPEDDFTNTILHELVHCKHLDMFYKWLVQLIVCLHWFNPLVYVMRKEISLACEMSCDEAVLKQTDGRAREYGDTLIHAIAINGSYKEACASVTLNENKQHLKERLEAIMNFKSKPKFALFTAAILVLGCLIGATLMGAYKAPKEPASIPAVTPPVVQNQNDNSNADKTPASSASDTDSSLISGKKSLSDFSGLDIQTLAANVTLIPSEENKVEYALRKDTTLKQCEVVDKTLIIETENKLSTHTTGYHQKIEYINVYYKKGTSFKNIDIESVSGDVEYDNLAAEKVVTNTVSGDIHANGIKADSIKIQSVSGDAEIENAQTKLADIGSVSGDIIAVGKIEGETTLSSTSGDIKLEALLPIKSYKYSTDTTSGDIYINHVKVKDSGSGDGKNKVNADTTSGNIYLSFAK